METKNLFKGKLEKIIPNTLDEGNPEHIVDGYILVNLGSLRKWCFVPQWKSYFPYHPKPSKHGVGERLIHNLIGKKTEIYFKFMDLLIGKLSPFNKRILQENDLPGVANHTTIYGQIIEEGEIKKVTEEEIAQVAEMVQKGIMKDIPRPKAYKAIYVDCGIIVKTSCDADAFNVGDYIKMEGRLDVYLPEFEGTK